MGLAGPRRTGKTTVADAAVAICAREGAYIASVDLFQAPDAASLAHQLALELLANRLPLRRAITDAARAGRSALEALPTTASFPAREDLGQDIEITLELSLAERAWRSAWPWAQSCMPTCSPSRPRGR